MLLALFMILTSFPLNAFAAQKETSVRNEITDIKTVGDKQVINLGNVRGEKPQLRFFSRGARLFGAPAPQAGSSSETVAQKVEINLSTMGLNLEEDQFDLSALTEAGSFDVEITFKELGGTRTETRTMTFQAGETKKTETFYLPKDFGNGNVEAEIPKLKENINLRVYVGAGSTTNFNLGQDMTYKFELTQIVHPVIDLKVVDPYGKELPEDINQALGLKLALEEEHKFDLPANTKTFNIRSLADFAGDNVADLNEAGANPTLSLTTALDANKKLTVGDKTYKLNKITYNALGQEVEINSQKKKVGGYIEFATQPKIIVPTPDDSGNLPKTPDGYKRLSFHAETSANAQDGRFENGLKVKVIDVLEGTEYTDTDLQKEIKGIGQPTRLINGRVDDNKKFLKWKPELPTTGPVADTDFYPVYLANGGEITPGEKLPDGVFEVKVTKDDTIAKDPLYGKSYGVFQGSKLARDKFPDLVAATGHQNPKWTTEADAPETGMVDIAKPWTKEITKATTFKATAAEDAATQIKKEGLKAVDTTALQGQDLDEKFWHKGVALADNTPAEKKADFEALLKEATVTDLSSRTSAKVEDQVGTLLVTFKDGSTLEVPNQKLIVKPNTVEVSFDNKAGDDAKAPRHKETVVKGKVSSTSGYPVKGAVVEIKDENNNVIGITQVIDDEGNFTAGTRELKAGEKLTASVTLPDSKLAAESKPKTVKLNADRLKDLLPIAQEQYKKFKDKENAFIKDKLNNLNTAIKTAEPLIKDGKATATDTADNQTAIDNAVKALEEALKALTANIPPSISGPKTHEIFVGEALDLKKLVDVTDGDGADDLVLENGSNVKIEVKKVEEGKETPVTELSTINKTVGTYKVTYTAKDKSDAKVTHEMTLSVKPRTTSAIEVTKDPNKMSYLITEKDGKAQLNLDGMTLNLVDNLGKKTKVELTDPKVKLKVNGRDVTNGAELTLADDVKFIEVEYTPEGSQTPLKAQTKGVLRVGPDYDGDKKDDRTQNFDPEKIEKLEVIKQPQLDYIAKDKSEADKVFKLNLEGMIIRMTDKAGKEKLAVVKNDGKFYDYDEPTKEIKQLTATPAHNAKLTPETAANAKGDNGKTVEIKSTNGKTTNTEPLKVFYDANKDGKPDHGQDQKTPAPSAMARNVGENPQGTTVEGMATPGAVIKITDKDGKPLTTEPKEVVAGPDGKYTATVKPILADGTDIKVTAKLGEMGESDPTPAKVFDDKNNNKQPDRDEGFNIAKATDIKFVEEPDLTYLVKTKDTEVTFDGKDAKGKPIYLELSYKNGDKTESKIMTLEDLMKDTDHIAVTPAKGTTDKIGNDPANLVGKAIEVKLVKANKTATSTSKFAIEIDADGNGKADKDETTDTPTVTARNIGENPTKTTVEGTAPKGSTVTIKYTTEAGQETTKTVIATPEGTYKLEIEPKLPVDTEVKVTAKDGEKKVSPEVKTQVFDDKDNDGKDDRKAGQTERPAALASNIGKEPAFTTITGEAEKGATVTAKVGKEVVGTATADSKTGKYTIQAKQNEKPIKEGVKIDVTATLAPKTESLKQTVVVFKDTDGTGQPDSAKDFDVKKAKEMQVVASPDKMVYSDGDLLNLDGLKVLVTDVNGNQKIFTYKHADNTEFTKAGLSVDLKQDTELSSKDYNAQTAKDGHNGRKLVVTLDTTGNTQVTEAITGKTPTALTVNKNQSAQPTDVVAANQGDATVTKVKGKATKDAEIKITDASGQSLLPKGTTIKAEANGDFTADLNKLLNPGTKVFVTATEPGKSESPKAETTVIRDKDENWKADTGSKLSTPVIDPIREKDEKVVVAAPKADDKIQTIEVSDQNGNKVTLTKDATGNTWTVVGSDPAKKVTEENGKIAIPVKGTLPLNDRDLIKVTFKDGEKPANEAFDREAVQKASQTPKVDQVYSGDKSVKIVDPTVADPTAKTIKVKVGKNDTRTIQKQDDGTWKDINNPNAKIEVKDGKVVVDLDPVAKKDDIIKVSTINDSKKESPAKEVTVIDKEKLDPPTINPIKTGGKTVSGTALTNKDKPNQFAASTVDIFIKDGNDYKLLKEGVGVNSDGIYNYTGTTPFKDGDVIRVVANKEDWTSSEAETTVGVDTTALDKAIQDGKDALDPNKGGINDGTPEDKALEKAIQDAENLKKRTDPKPPTQKELDDAKDKIEKAIENKKKIDEERQKLKDIIEEAEKETQKDGYKDKLDADKKALEKAIADGKENLKNNTKITESTNTIKEKLDIIRMERIVVGVESLAVGLKTLEIKTSVPGATVKIKIGGVLIDTIKTDGYGKFSRGLKAPLEENQEIVLEASKPGYNDGEFSDNVY